jgi:hypothetical protein
MSNPKRLDAPPANLRELDRGSAVTKAIGVEPRLIFPKEEPVFKREAAAKEEAEKLAKSAGPVPPDLAKAMKTMSDLANIALKAAQRSEAAAQRIEAALVEKAAPSIKSALAKIDQAGLFKKGR